MNIEYVLQQAEAQRRTVMLAGGKGYRCQIEKKGTNKILASAVADEEQTAIMMACADLQKELGIADGPMTKEQTLESRIAKLEAKVAMLEEAAKPNIKQPTGTTAPVRMAQEEPKKK